MNIPLLNRLAIIEYNNLKGICPFVFKCIESKNKPLYLKNFHIHNDYLHINDQEINNNKKILWQSTLYFKNGYDQNILLFDHLRGKYKIK
jgi:hypothetical protein